jgi:phosphoadenosine phosphosulfate reductase
MRVTMVKKRLKNGEPCQKCAQAEELLRRRGLWQKIDEVVWAEEGAPESQGMELARRFGIELAPFFVVEDGGGSERLYESVIKLMKALEPQLAVAGAAAAELDIESAARELADGAPEKILRWGLERFGRDCAIAFSGAEDVALIEMASKLGLPFSVFTLDTGRLHPETYRFIDKVRSHYGIEIDVVFPQADRIEALVRKKGLFSFYVDGHEECCAIRKVEPLSRALLARRAWVTGQRSDQSPATRADLPVIELDRAHRGAADRLLKLNPLARWTASRVWEYLRDNDAPHNELHDRGFRSIGCEPCTRVVLPHEHERAGRWWWEEATQRECGLHLPQKR